MPGRISEVMVSADGGKLGFGRTSGAGTEHGVHSLSYAVAMERSAVLQSRAWDEDGNVQPTRTKFVAARGQLPSVPPVLAFENHHFNAITRLAAGERDVRSGRFDLCRTMFRLPWRRREGCPNNNERCSRSAGCCQRHEAKRNGIDDTTLTIANYWPDATTLFDYIRRSMPWTSPRSLTDDQVYAPTAYILAQTKLIDAKQVINAQTLPKVQMPNRNGLFRVSRSGCLMAEGTRPPKLGIALSLLAGIATGAAVVLAVIAVLSRAPPGNILSGGRSRRFVPTTRLSRERSSRLPFPVLIRRRSAAARPSCWVRSSRLPSPVLILRRSAAARPSCSGHNSRPSVTNRAVQPSPAPRLTAQGQRAWRTSR